MKVIRIWLLVLLAALLPARGAIAAAMLCPPAAVGSDTMLMQHGHQDHAPHDHADSAQHGDHGGTHDHTHDSKGPAGHDKCNLCSACCSATPLLSAMPSVPQPHGLAAASFPDVSAPAPSFLSDGQERPPRSF
ncbi:hypothetical protein [Ideonella sp.]|uniref:hypothetical protein n=1 Tax=Ideonella sp. TaxID=1929293 RepID=UPI0035ADB902